MLNSKHSQTNRWRGELLTVSIFCEFFRLWAILEHFTYISADSAVNFLDSWLLWLIWSMSAMKENSEYDVENYRELNDFNNIL